MSVTCIGCNSQNIQEIVKENRRYIYCEDCKQVYERAIDTTYGRDRVINTEEGVVHECVGALIQKDGQYLLIKRRAYPFGYGLPAGHVEYNEAIPDALKREVFEETGLTLTNCETLFEGFVPGSKCRYGADRHIWHYYACDYEGEAPFLNSESEAIGWYSLADIQKLDLIPSAQFIFDKVLRGEV